MCFFVVVVVNFGSVGADTRRNTKIQFCPIKKDLVKVLFTTQIAWTLYKKEKKVS